jgi:hypothetical protein
MAKRPIFAPIYEGPIYILEEYVDFTWHPGLSLSQKQKSIDELHYEASAKFGLRKPLEISSKSENPVGVALSSFNLTFTTKHREVTLTVESAFQGSKVFESGGPYRDIFFMPPKEAKRDERLRNSGSLKGFSFFGISWPLVPRTSFYDWLYINAVMNNPNLYDKVTEYDYFTDIEFNPERSVNCQARSAALYLSLKRRGILDAVLSDPESFRSIYQEHMPEPLHINYHRVLV